MANARINLNKQFIKLSEYEKTVFYNNVKKTVYKYICKHECYSEMAYECIDDAYMKGIKVANTDVNLRSLRSYIGTIAWHMFNKEKKRASLSNKEVYVDNIENYDREDEIETYNTISNEFKDALRELKGKDKEKLADMVRFNMDYNRLQCAWNLSYTSCRQAVFKIRKIVQNALKNNKGELN